MTQSPSDLATKHQVRWVFEPYDMDTQSGLAVGIYCRCCEQPIARNAWRFFKPLNAVSGVELMQGVHSLQLWVDEQLAE